MNKRGLGGFALPTVLVASMIMLVVLLSAVSSTASVRNSIVEQSFNQLSRSAADAGAAYAQACLDENGGVPSWSSPLTPSTDCSGSQLAGLDCSSEIIDPRCYVSANGNVVSTFSVSTAETSSLGWSVSEVKLQTVAGGGSHYCGLSFSKNVYCWGSSTYGQTARTDGTSYSPRYMADLAGITGSKAKSVTVGNNHSCAIASTGKVFCWGDKTNGALGLAVGQNSGFTAVPTEIDTTNIPGDKTFKSISAGYDHTCGIASNNYVYCWGDNAYGQLGSGVVGTDSDIPVALKTTAQTSGRTMLAVAAGSYFTCALRDGGTVICWGRGNSGQLGYSSSPATSIDPVAVSVLAGGLQGKTVLSISAAGEHACVTASDGATGSLPYCWGNGLYGRLGNGLTSNYNYPVAVTMSGLPAGSSVSSISAGTLHTCMTSSDNKAYCWGEGASGRLGNNDIADQTTPVAVDTSGLLNDKKILLISAGYDNTFSIASDGQMYSWGARYLGTNSTSTSQIPVAVYTKLMPDERAVKVVSLGRTLVIKKSNGSALRSYKSYSKVKIANRAWKQIATGAEHVCAITTEGDPYCWGDNTYGQLGNNSTTDRSQPTAVYMGGVLSGKTIISISSGEWSTCAIASDNYVYCWGRNNFGQLGDNVTAVGSQSTVPVAVNKTGMGDKTVTAISVGSVHACAIASTGLAYCWGSNSNGGQLGNSNLNVNSNTPVAVTTSGVLSGLTIISISAGYHHTCAVASNNLVYCWGSNRNKNNDGDTGQVGNNNASPTNPAPVAVNTAGLLSGKKILSVSSSQYNSCVIASDSLTYCWGYDGFGTLGNDDFYQTSFVPVLALASPGGTALQTFSSRSSICSIAWNGSLYCWGDNTQGQVGNNSGVDQPLPVLSVSSLGNISSMSVSNGVSWTNCVLTYDVQSYCWGALIEPNGGLNGDILSGIKSIVPIKTPPPPTSMY